MAVCPICGNEFLSRYECALHIEVNHPDDVRFYMGMYEVSEDDIRDFLETEIVEEDYTNVSPRFYD